MRKLQHGRMRLMALLSLAAAFTLVVGWQATHTATAHATLTPSAHAPRGDVVDCTQTAAGRHVGLALVKTKLKDTPTGLQVTWIANRRLPSVGTIAYYVITWDLSGGHGPDIVVKYRRGSQIPYFLDYALGRTRLPGRARVAGDSIEAFVPLAQRGMMTHSFVWRSTLKVDGNIASICGTVQFVP